jgi:ATP:ADP antiporter, AAA family
MTRKAAALTLLQKFLPRLTEARPEEVPALLASFLYFFFLLCSYYMLRPLRDAMGVAGGIRDFQWLFTATFLVMLAAVPLFGAVVARLPPRRFVPLIYRIFAGSYLDLERSSRPAGRRPRSLASSSYG